MSNKTYYDYSQVHGFCETLASRLKNKQFDLTDLINKCLKLKKKIGIYEIPNNAWTDLGKLSDFSKAFKDFN